MTLADLTASNSARLAELAKPSWFIDDPEYQEAVANFMHEATIAIRKEKEHEQPNLLHPESRRTGFLSVR